MAKTNKLQNIKAVQQMIDGTHKFQTKKSVGFSDAEATKKRNEHHKIGDVWEDVDANGNITIIEQFDGFRTKKPKNSQVLSEVREELRLYAKCPKDTCTCDPNYYLNQKMRAIHEMCFDCVIDMEHELKKTGQFKEYANNKLEANALAWLKKAEHDVDMLRDAYTKASELVINSEGDTETWAAQMTPEEFEEKITKGFESYKIDFLDKLNKTVTGETK
jgi:hypothetical protein|tara:strand:+ start:174 stop:827 length:654 start_codon:yes stop_codon:yes gene_type:complete